ncbi:sce7726 family protein [Patescibacteria group bacterium]|nr:sce7726 family protein [Patescibacteria group bacterium]
MSTNGFTPTSDQVIRAALLKQLIQTNFLKEHTRVIPELTLPNESVRVDVAVVNGIMHGYELKSDLDKLNRLDTQVLAYSSVFDKVTLVVGKKHAVSAIAMIPDWWGITLAKAVPSEMGTMLIPIREAYENPNQNLLAISNLLWKNEAVEYLTAIGEISGLRSKSKKIICERLIECISPSELKAFVRDTLINRKFVRAKQVALSLDSCGD